jgi:preprotein translocase subunit SecA
MPDRSWEQGLHQLVEAKEGVELTSTRETLARITYQRFFNRYLRLSGMTGTAREVAGELRAIYGLHVVSLPANRKLRRRNLGSRLMPDAAAKWTEVARRASRFTASGRPLLVGTQSVEASEALSAELSAHGLPHVVLNARQDAGEAEIVAAAGQPQSITVATNMAGRGTDIELGPGVAEAGGLHVILTGYHDSARIDRQLFGRAGRQGDPGSYESVVALDDELFERFAPRLTRMVRKGGWLGRLAWQLMRRRAQAAASRGHARQRREQVLADERFDQGMGFSGRE